MWEEKENENGVLAMFNFALNSNEKRAIDR
jgi:hypothetical protein